MNEITSLNNELVKNTAKLHQKKYRDESGLFLLEGDKPVREAYSGGIEIKYAFVEKEKSAVYEFLGEKLIPTTEAVLKKISTTDTPPDVIAVGVKKTFSTASLKEAQKVVLLENIKDTGNLGTILRTSAAFGADAVVLYGDTVDLYNPKCVRAAVGNLWKLPAIHLNELDEMKKLFADFQRVATLPRGENYLKNFKRKEKVLVMFGSEADGLSDELTNFATDKVKIEMTSDVESLNLSAACAVVLYQMFIV